MGIPVYFKTLINQYQDDILITEQIDNVEALFLDLNCLIHPCCRGETDEDIMIQKILDGITTLIEYSQVQRLVYIAIDGVAPKGKMKQQKMRRYKSILENKSWDTNAISPGTYFMNKLNDSLEKYNYKDLDIIKDNSNKRGEGEHKILQYIKTNEISKSVIYGLDADLIMLSLSSRKPNIFLLRERTEYNIEQTESEYIYLHIDKLKEKIKGIFKVDTDNVIDDYIFVCFLLGNDFMNNIPSINLRYDGHKLLIDTYLSLQKEYDGYFYLIDRSSQSLICFTFFKEYMERLSLQENKHFLKQQSRRENQFRRIYSQYSSEFLELQRCIHKRDLTMNLIHDFSKTKIDDKYYEMINHLPILYYPNEKKELPNYLKESKKSELSNDYFKSLLWTTHYYFKECIHWKWCSTYHRVPLLRDLSNYLNNTQTISIEKENESFTIEEQLNYILPHQSDHVHKYKINKKEYELRLDISFKRYLWECEIEFI